VLGASESEGCNEISEKLNFHMFWTSEMRDEVVEKWKAPHILISLQK